MEQLYGIAIVPLIIGLVGLAKASGLNRKHAGLLAWGLGVAVALGYGLTEAGWTVLQSLVVGSFLGLSASGLYSTGKNTLEAEVQPDPYDDDPPVGGIE